MNFYNSIRRKFITMSMRNLSSSTFLLSFCPTSGQASLSSSSELPESSAPSLPWAPSIGVCIKSRHRKIFPLAPTPNHSKNQSHLHSQLTLVLLRIWPEGSFLGNPFTIFSVTKFISHPLIPVSHSSWHLHISAEGCGRLHQCPSEVPGPPLKHLH